MLRPLSWPGWKIRSWVKRLSGTTSNPFTVARGAAWWIASLRATRANRSLTPESEVVQTMSGICGRISGGLLERYSPTSSFSRTYQGTFRLALTLFEPTYSEWATALRLDSLARRKLARRMNGSGSTSWPSARAEDSQSCGNHPRGESDSLTGMVRSWSTPVAGDSTRGAPQKAETLAARYKKSGGGMRTLTNDLGIWHTPTVSTGDWTKDNGKGPKRPTLIGQAKHYPTPTASAYGTSQNGINKTRPSASTPSLETMASSGLLPQVSYPTPAARDGKGANSEAHVRENGTGRKHLDQLPNFVAHTMSDPSRPDQTSSTNGGESLSKTRVLNPRFVEWLMSWPLGWTDCAAPVTEWTRYRQLWRSFLFGSSW
jgi:hypothetical protein